MHSTQPKIIQNVVGVVEEMMGSWKDNERIGMQACMHACILTLILTLVQQFLYLFYSVVFWMRSI